MLTDAFGRTVDYLRISVTDRCDLRCTYCLPKGFKGFSVPKEWLSIEELARVASAFARLGTKRFRLTGGEPLLRRNLERLVAERTAQLSSSEANIRLILESTADGVYVLPVSVAL